MPLDELVVQVSIDELPLLLLPDEIPVEQTPLSQTPLWQSVDTAHAEPARSR